MPVQTRDRSTPLQVASAQGEWTPRRKAVPAMNEQISGSYVSEPDKTVPFSQSMPTNQQATNPIQQTEKEQMEDVLETIHISRENADMTINKKALLP